MISVPLYLLRHGEPLTKGLLLGRTDLALTAEGLTASMRQLEDLRTTRIISSGMGRTDQIAALYAKERGSCHVIDRRWQELDFGDWDGRSPSDLPDDRLMQFWTAPDRYPPPNGERHGDRMDRVRSALDDLALEPTVVVAHAGSIRAAISLLCGFDYQQSWAIEIPYAARVDLMVYVGDSRKTSLQGLRK